MKERNSSGKLYFHVPTLPLVRTPLERSAPLLKHYQTMLVAVPVFPLGHNMLLISDMFLVITQSTLPSALIFFVA